MRPTGPGQAAHLLLDVVDVLNELCIPYALAGALAASYYGVPRSTSDADTSILQSLETTRCVAITTPYRANSYLTVCRWTKELSSILTEMDSMTSSTEARLPMFSEKKLE